MSVAISACPACNAAPSAEDIARRQIELHGAKLTLSVPTAHCAACISTVENELRRVDGVKDARVNLSLKRVMIDADGSVTAEQMIRVLQSVGYPAFELDGGALHTTATDRAGRDLLMRLAVAGFAMMNVMLLSISVWSGADGVTRDLFHWISALIAIPTVAFAGKPFFTSAWSALRVHRLNMDVPISLAILLAVVTSLWETMLSGEHAYFDAAVSLIFFLLAGRYLDYRTRAIARSAAEELAALEVPRAIRLDANGTEETVMQADLRIGDLILVRPGGRMPVDGVITAGQSELDRSLLTGETLPVFAQEGTVVSAGEINLTGPLTIRATAVGKDTSLHRLADLVAVAESGRSKYTSLADAAAKLYAPGVHILSAIAFAGWWLYAGDFRMAVNIAAAVLIITCPCALGLAVPAVTTAASGRLFKQGLLIKDATALERLAQVDTVVFDKTGTLTTGKMRLANGDQIGADDMALALGLASASSHPLARALAGHSDIAAQGVADLVEWTGYGVEGVVDGQKVRLGRAAWVGAEGSTQTAMWLQTRDGRLVEFAFTDEMRGDAASAIAALKQSGKRVILATGDVAGAAQSAAAILGIGEVHAEVLPKDKLTLINDLHNSGAKVLMVGDGLNDTAALRAAHVSISPATALDAARVASDIVLLGTELGPISSAIATAQSATLRIRENFQIATAYNVIAIPVAMAALATPLIAALAMSLSSITVSLNALRLR